MKGAGGVYISLSDQGFPDERGIKSLNVYFTLNIKMINFVLALSLLHLFKFDTAPL